MRTTAYDPRSPFDAPASSSGAGEPVSDVPTELLRTLPRAAYVDPDHFAREVDRIWLSEWVCVGREESIPSAGDYLNVDVVGERILVVRGRSGEIAAFDNVCRHRGSQLVLDPPPAAEEPGPHGRFKGAIRCPYHAWTYGLDGGLRNAPFLTESDGLRKEQLSLYRVAVDTWGGFVFVNLTPEELTPERELTARLGDVPARTANYSLAELRTGHRITYEVAANWKAIVENYNECYHCGPVHPELCEVVPAFKDGGGRGLDWDAGVPHREGATTFTFSGTTDRAPFPGLTDEEKERHKGELVYPNLMLSLAADHVAAFTLSPTGPDHTRIRCDFLCHPDELARASFDPSDAVEFWDIVNRQDWRICESVQRGMRSRRFTAGYYAPMEDPARDIRRYLAETLGDG